MLPLAAAALLASSAGIEISGRVYIWLEQSRQPAAGVRVLARPEHGGAPVAAAITDGQGGYILRELPRARLAVAVVRPGWVTRGVEGGDGILVIDTGPGGAVTGADFELVAGGVVTGRITDAWNEPRPKVNVALYRMPGAGGAAATPSATGRSDDRGYYRLFGLEPGRYILQARPAERLQDEPASVYYPGTSDSARAREVEVKAGGETAGIDVALRPEPVYRLAGRVGEVEARPGRLVVLALRLAEGPEPPAPVVGQVAADGSFTVAGLRAGTYAVTAGERPEGGGVTRGLAREIVEIQSDVTGVVLRPARPARLDGRVTFSGGSSTRRPPAGVRLRLNERGSRAVTFADAKSPEYLFQVDALWPGSYTVEVAAPSGVYLRQARPGPDGAAEVTVPVGGSVSVVIEAGVDPGSVTGLVKSPGTKRPQPHARVVLARRGARIGAQADQNGRFAFPAVGPGEYRIRAWASADEARLEDPRAWEQPEVRRFMVEPNGEIDLELTATP